MESERFFADAHQYYENIEREQYEEMKPTHFIEVYKFNDGTILNTFVPLPIEYLSDQLQRTKSVLAKTIAVFKIKFKNAD